MINPHFMPLLYIDPGTGSMLFSILIGAAATLYFLFRALIIKLKVVFSGGRKRASANTLHAFVIYSEGKQYWNVFKPIFDEFEKVKQEILFLTSSEDDPVFDSEYLYVKSEFIGEGNKAFARLNFLSADVVLMTTPGLQVYQLKRSKSVKHYSHILHAPSDATLYRLFGIDYFDSILLTGGYQENDIRFLEKLRGIPEKQLFIAGCTYLDVYAQEIKKIPKEDHHPFTVLVSPSWGSSALLYRYGKKLLDPLINTGWRIIVRPHPQSKKSEKETLENLRNYYEEAENLEWDYARENIFSLARADIMISDFSGIVFDFAFLCDKPVMYVKQGLDLRPYDADDLDHELWQFATLREIGVELKEEDFNSIKKIISDISDDISLKQGRLKAKEAAWQYPGEAGKRITEFMINIQKQSKGADDYA